MTQHETPDFKSGFVTIAGAPNVGKSTLMNRYLREKISITSPKPQTTRNRIPGILTGPGYQIVFIDTPGIHKSKKLFNTKIVETAVNALDSADLILVMTDVSRPKNEAEEFVLTLVTKRSTTPAILAMNKIDLVEKTDLLAQIDRFAKMERFLEIIPISATEGTQTDELLAAMIANLPNGHPYYPEDMITDLPERFIVAELIREKIFHLTGEEIPYASAVTIESFKEIPEKNLIRIHAVIHVERKSQKGIIIGKNGSMLKAIGQAARLDMEMLLGARIYLELFVRVEKNWSKRPSALKKLGYE